MKADSINELLAWTPPRIVPVIGGGLLMPENKMFMYGRYKSWKSMVAMHTAFCVAMGRPWFGFTTSKMTTIVLQVELPKYQYRNRVQKYVIGNGLSPDGSISIVDNLHIITEPFIKLDQGYGSAEFEKEIQRLHPGLVIVDPAYKVVSGRITDEYDMRKFTDRMDNLIAKYHFSLIIIHHDRKEQIFEGQAVNMGSQDMFGTSIFLDWCDTAIKIEPQATDAEVRMIPDIVRHAEVETKPFMVSVDRETLQFKVK